MSQHDGVGPASGGSLRRDHYLARQVGLDAQRPRSHLTARNVIRVIEGLGVASIISVEPEILRFCCSNAPPTEPRKNVSKEARRVPDRAREQNARHLRRSWIEG
jgi:hypothetical protein